MLLQITLFHSFLWPSSTPLCVSVPAYVCIHVYVCVFILYPFIPGQELVPHAMWLKIKE